jgi:hypothetical protein
MFGSIIGDFFLYFYLIVLIATFVIFGRALTEVAIELFRKRRGRGVVYGGKDGIGYNMAIHFDPVQRGPHKPCPNCDEMVPENAISCRFCGIGLTPPGRKECPSCGLKVPDFAVYCRYCGEKIVVQDHPSVWTDLNRPIP